jgi:hypothetical protein
MIALNDAFFGRFLREGGWSEACGEVSFDTNKFARSDQDTSSCAISELLHPKTWTSPKHQTAVMAVSQEKITVHSLPGILTI